MFLLAFVHLDSDCYDGFDDNSGQCSFGFIPRFAFANAGLDKRYSFFVGARSIGGLLLDCMADEGLPSFCRVCGCPPVFVCVHYCPGIG